MQPKQSKDLEKNLRKPTNKQWKRKEIWEQTCQNIGTLIKDTESNDYFNWKSHKFKVTEAQARSNSSMMDNVIKDINEENKDQKLQELNESIREQYKQATWENIELSEEQLRTIIEAHKSDWTLWKLTQWELRKKVKILKKDIDDKKLIRFLLEAGFCGSFLKNLLWELFWTKKANVSHFHNKNKINRQRETHSRYRLWEIVNIPRSDWRITKAEIYDYNPQTWIYIVWRAENWEAWYKELSEEILNCVNSRFSHIQTNWKYKIWEIVNIPRSDWRVTKAIIYRFDAQTWEYTVTRAENWEAWHKKLSELALDNVNPKNQTDIINPNNTTDEISDESDEEDNQEFTCTVMDNSEYNIFRELRQWNDEYIYLQYFWEPKNIIKLWKWQKLYVTNCLVHNGRKYIIWYIKKWNKIRVRLFYKSLSEWARRACPWLRTDRWYSKWENIPNSSYETTTKVSHETEYIFDNLPEENTDYNPIRKPVKDKHCRFEFLEAEMNDEIKIDKLFKEYKNNTCSSFAGRPSQDVINMYKNLWKNFNLEDMEFLEWEWYTYEHQYLWTIEVQICRLKYNWKYINFHFAKAKDDPKNRVRIEQISYADARITSFWIYDKQINAAPLTWKPIEYACFQARQVPSDREWERYWEDYMDIRDLYQENPIIKQFKKISSI